MRRIILALYAAQYGGIDCKVMVFTIDELWYNQVSLCYIH